MKQFFINLIFLYFVFSKSEARPLPPPATGVSRKNYSNQPECRLGEKIHELGSTWYAGTGPSSSVNYCIKCECVPVIKRSRLLAKVDCRDIKTECPKLNCDDAVQLPGKCCKVCQGNINVTSVREMERTQEEEQNMKHFSALLTTRTSYFLKREEIKTQYSIKNPMNIVATGRFTFHNRNLYFSFYVSKRPTRPRVIQFIDDTGLILEEIPLIQSSKVFSVYQNATGKQCGVWRRVPRNLYKKLNNNQVNVVLLWGGQNQAELALAGKISTYSSLSTEMFSSLLEASANKGIVANQMFGAGGTAMVSANFGVSPSIQLTVVFNGLFYDEERADVKLNIRLESIEEDQTLLEDTAIVQKVSYDYNVIEFSSKIPVDLVEMLPYGKLRLIIESQKTPNILRIQGQILPRVTCEMYQTLLASPSPNSHAIGSGLAWAFINRNGALVYNVLTDALNLEDKPIITLVDEIGKQSTEIAELKSALNESSSKSIGVIQKLDPQMLKSLYDNDLIVNIAMEKEPNLIRGQLNGKHVADARDSSEPILLQRLDISSANLIGMAWIAVDNECTLHYEISLNNSNNKPERFELYLEEKPMEALNAPVTTTLLDEFNGDYFEGFVMGMTWYELSKLESSVCYLQIKSKENGQHLLKGLMHSVKIPNHCYPPTTDSNVPSVVLTLNDQNDPENGGVSTNTKCFHSKQFYDEGSQWTNELESCSMCHCTSGNVKCDKYECPPLNCKSDEIRQPRKGECCPSCIEAERKSINGTGCAMGDRFHGAGSIWYPYLPPKGFDKCTICSCDSLTLEINCPHVECPVLNCTEDRVFQPTDECCQKCSNETLTKAKIIDVNSMGDQGSKKGKYGAIQDILANGGCTYLNTIRENGQEWHPILPSIGEQKCIKCQCKESRITCDPNICGRPSRDKKDKKRKNKRRGKSGHSKRNQNQKQKKNFQQFGLLSFRSKS